MRAPGGNEGRPAPPGRVAIVPVHGGAALLDRCLERLCAGTDLSRDRLLIVLDGPQEVAVEAVLERRLAGRAGAEVLRLAARGGFSAAVNAGLERAAPADVVLLNSDTEVPPGWLERLAAAADSAPRIASVTPLTNHGTLASAPRFFAENALPAGFTLESFAALVERISERRYPRLPTGVGFCLYLRRAALDAVGRLDAATFGRGYGEEVDWCLRAAELGFEHRLDDATFVFHRGGGSFGSDGRTRAARAQRILERRHPGYRREISRFTRENPLQPVLQRIWEALQPARQPPPSGPPLRLVHVVHGWPPWNHAGTESHAARLVRRQAPRHHVTVYSRYAPADRELGHALELVDGGARVRLVANRFAQRDPASRNALHERRLRADFGRLLEETRPDLVHVHHLAGHCLTLPREAVRRGIPIVWQLQDWWALCARANLLDAERRLCSGPAPAKCARCLPLTALPPARLASRLLYRLRARLARAALAGAAAFVAGSAGVIEAHRRAGLLPAGVPVRLLDYGVADPPRRPEERPAERPPGPLRLGFIGSVLPHKGLHLLAAAVSELAPGQARLDVWGDPRDAAYLDEVRRAAGAADLRFQPPFEEERRAEVLAAIDLLVVPSLGLESYAFAAREALAAGVPILVARRGVLADLVAGGGGAAFDPERPAELAALLHRLVAAPETLAEWRATIPAVGRFEDHVEAIEGIYREVLGRAERRRGQAPGRR